MLEWSMAHAPGSLLDGTLMLPSATGLDALPDAELTQRQRDFAAARRQVDAGAALVAAEIARRSSRERGYDGLAAREGARSPERLVEKLAGVTPDEARALVRVGSLLSTSEPAASDAAVSWLDDVASAVACGSISVLAAEAIQRGLGEPSTAVPSDALSGAASLLVQVAPDLPLRRLAAEARALRDSLDSAGVADREQLLRERRFLRLTPQSDGMTRLAGLLDPESAAIVSDSFDLVTAPRLGGPRFLSDEARQREEAIMRDPRTTEQLLADAFVELIRIAGQADAGRVYVQRRPAVTIHIERHAVDAGVGSASIEGQSSAVSVATAERHACAAGAIPVQFDGDRVLALGREQRFFTWRQRVALAARDGGCRFDGCDRPPSWCEAHHIDEWVRDHGATDVDRGVLLCRFHHLLVHNRGWRIEARGSGFTAVPPPGEGPPRPMPSRNTLRRRVSRS